MNITCRKMCLSIWNCFFSD